MRSNDYGVKATVTIRSFGIPHQWITMVDMLSHLNIPNYSGYPFERGPG